MSCIGLFFIRIVIFILCFFYSLIAIIGNSIRILVKIPNYCCGRKKRSEPPDCLYNPAYGKHVSLELKDVTIHCVENGDRSKPLMLFVHGFPEFWFSWRFQLEEFARTHWVVAIDLRGYGESGKPGKKSDYKMETLEKDVVNVVIALNRQQCILVAHDWGGLIAWNVATHYPEIVEKLIILNSPHPLVFRQKIRSTLAQFFKSSYIFFFQTPFLPEWIFQTDDSSIFNQVFLNQDKKCSITPEDIEAYRYTFSKKGAWKPTINYYRQNFSASAFFGKEPPVEPKIRVKTLIVWGKDDVALANDFPELARAHVNDLTIHYIPGSHFIQEDNPSQVNALISEFVKFQ